LKDTECGVREKKFEIWNDLFCMAHTSFAADVNRYAFHFSLLPKIKIISVPEKIGCSIGVEYEAGLKIEILLQFPQ